MNMIHRELKLIEVIDNTSYTQLFKNEIINVLYDFFNTKVSNIYLITRLYSKYEETIFLIQHLIPVIYEFKAQLFVSVLIYLPSKFPLVGPEIYLEKKEINAEVKTIDHLINNSTLRINYESFIKWNSESKNFAYIIQMIKMAFDKQFPWSYVSYPVLYYNGLCVLQTKYILPITLNEEEKPRQLKHEQRKYHRCNIMPIEGNYIEKKQPSLVIIEEINQDNALNKLEKTNKTVFNNEVLMNELSSIKFTSDIKEQEEIEEILRNEILYKLPNIISHQKAILLEDKETLVSILQQLKDKQKNHNESFNIISSFDILNKKMNYIESHLIKEINDKSTIPSLAILYDNLTDLISIDQHNNKLLHYTCIEKTIEEFLYFLKKSLEKNLMPIQEIIKQHLISTRQLFFIHHLKQKELNNDYLQ